MLHVYSWKGFPFIASGFRFLPLRNFHLISYGYSFLSAPSQAGHEIQLSFIDCLIKVTDTGMRVHGQFD